MARLYRRIRADERGAAIAIVMLVGVVLVLLSSIMVARGYRQLVNTSNDTHWDNALFAAEAPLHLPASARSGNALAAEERHTTCAQTSLSEVGCG